MEKRTLQVDVHREPTGYWAEVPELEGCFASGETLDELVVSLHECLSLYLGEDEPERILTRVVGLALELEPDLRPADVDGVTCSPSHRKRQSHWEDWPPPFIRP